MKKILLLICIICFGVSFVRAQACGGSVRTVSLKYQTNKKPPEKVGYELFYLVPKDDASAFNDYEKLSEFLAEFLGDETKKGIRFWGGYGKENPFVNVPTKKAENYINDYKLEDFKLYYTIEYNKHHLSQLKGNFEDGTLRLKTTEMDITPFIMKIKAENHETLYLLSSFLGGCFDYDAKQTIQMSRTKK